jgi:hypothetical protein
MNFFEALKTAQSIIEAIKMLIAAIEKLNTSNQELVSKNNEVLAALQTQNEFSLMASNKPEQNHAA